MKLNIKDRIIVPQILPQNGNFMQFNIKRGILKKIVLTEEDRDKYEIKEDPEQGRVSWNIEKDASEPLVVNFSEDEIKYLQESCEKIADQEFSDDFWVTVEKIYDASKS